jgi:ABC-type nitrate/sulfonate/bicarbonate transport system substrate-binding protein
LLRNEFIEKNPNTARQFVTATARAIEWSRHTPREQVITRFEKIIRERKRNERTSALKYWRATRALTDGGDVGERDFQLWIDWLVRDGQLKEGQVRALTFYTNELNPYAGTAKPVTADLN